MSEETEATETVASKKVLILGAGWYGCYTAQYLLKRYPSVHLELYDIQKKIFGGSSSKNQNRLHLGFHYPRSFKTRSECRAGYTQFLHSFPKDWVYDVDAYYVIDDRSMLDFPTYCAIYEHERTPHSRVSDLSVLPFTIANEIVEGGIKTDEKAIAFSLIQSHYETMLGSYLRTEVPRHEDYDLVLDCTYGQLLSESKDEGAFMETCLTLVYKFVHFEDLKRPFGFTVMDGKHGFSLYPYRPEKGWYTLTHVTYTPICTGVTTPSEDQIVETRQRMEREVLRILPNFHEDFIYNSYFISYKCKPSKINTDDRSIKSTVRKTSTSTLLSLYGGKITGIFEIPALLRAYAGLENT